MAAGHRRQAPGAAARACSTCRPPWPTEASSGRRESWTSSPLALQPNTGALQLRAEFPNPQHTLLPGQFVRVRLLGLKRNDAILVPQRAVQQGLNGPFVYVLADSNKVSARPVTATAWQGTQWIIEDGLRPGDKVIVDGVQKIRPDAPVRPVAYRPQERHHACGPRPDTTVIAPPRPRRRSRPTPPRAGRAAMSDTPEIRYLFVRRPIFAAVISIVIVLLGVFALHHPADQPVSPDHSALGPGLGGVSGRHRGRRRQRGGGADRAAALRARRPAVLQVVQRQRRDDEPAGVLRPLAGPRPRGGGRAEPGQPGPAAAAPGGRAAGDHHHQGPDRHSRGHRAQLEGSRATTRPT